jgi:hypothetical protein
METIFEIIGRCTRHSSLVKKILHQTMLINKKKKNFTYFSLLFINSEEKEKNNDRFLLGKLRRQERK